MGIPYSVDALCTDVCPVLIDSSAFSKSSGDQVVGAALNGAASLMPSLLAILYNVLLGIPVKNKMDNAKVVLTVFKVYRMLCWLYSQI